MIIIQTTNNTEQDRTEEFRTFAQRRAAGEVPTIPTLLPPEERRLYVRHTLREDHQFRIHNRPEGAQGKFATLADSFFKFFRGTALLYYRDYAGTDAHLPIVFTVGDVHPENFGVMPNDDGAPFFGVNDFDEAYFAPFTYDVKRGAVGFYIAAWVNDFSKKERKKVVRAFAQGYIDALKEFAMDDREKWHEFRIDNSPPMIRDLLESARTRREEFLSELIDLELEEFVSSDEIVPHTRHIADFQKIVDRYVKENEIDTKTRGKNFFKVKDVAIKKDSGTASRGLDRYFVLIEGPESRIDRDIVLEMKQVRRSALYGLVPYNDGDDDAGTTRAIEAHDVQLVGGDPYYGRIEIDGNEFLVRERSPYKDDIDVDDLGKDEMIEYARICAKALAQTHARSDEDTGAMEGNAEKEILATINPPVFCDDIVRFARMAAKRIHKDYEAFKKDFKLGAFNFYASGNGNS